MRLILASASPRRADLLRAAGFDFETVSVDVDERALENETAAAYVRRLAVAKSLAAMEQLGGPTQVPGRCVVIGADTAVVVDGAILGKPRDAREAESMLRRLSGRRHEVLTGLSVRSGRRELGCVESTAVFCSTLSDADVSWYVGSGEGRDKAGGYAIQGLASRFIPRIEGSYSNVVGLPVACVAELIRQVQSD